MIARRLIKMLSNRFEINTLTTKKSKTMDPNVFFWNTETGDMDNNAIVGVKGIIHLAGFPVAEKWSDKNKKLMKDSRIKAAEMLLRACAEVQVRPEFFISSSAIGYYGYGRTGKMDEYKLAGEGFIARLCEDWEKCSLVV